MSILPIHFPPVAQGAYFYFLDGIVNGGQHPIIAYSYSRTLSSPQLVGPHGLGVGFPSKQPFDDPS
jgi:hypothetical protein